MNETERLGDQIRSELRLISEETRGRETVTVHCPHDQDGTMGLRHRPEGHCWEDGYALLRLVFCHTCGVALTGKEPPA